MSTHRFVKSDGSSMDVRITAQESLEDVKYDLALGMPPGGTEGVLLGTGQPEPGAPSVTVYVTGASQSAARLALDDLWSFANASRWLERYLPDGSTLPELRLAGDARARVMTVKPVGPTGLHLLATIPLNAVSAGQRWYFVQDVNGDGLADANGDVLVGLGG